MTNALDSHGMRFGYGGVMGADWLMGTEQQSVYGNFDSVPGPVRRIPITPPPLLSLSLARTPCGVRYLCRFHADWVLLIRCYARWCAPMHMSPGPTAASPPTTTPTSRRSWARTTGTSVSPPYFAGLCQPSRPRTATGRRRSSRATRTTRRMATTAPSRTASSTRSWPRSRGGRSRPPTGSGSSTAR